VRVAAVSPTHAIADIDLAGACLVVLAAVGAALASIPAADGVIHACRKVDGGRLRAVVSARRCRADERPLKWNVRGRQGEPGTGLESFDALAGLGCTVGSTSGTITIDYDATSGEAHIRCVVAPPPPALVRVNEFSTGTEGALANEFIELVNTGTEPAELSGFKLVYRSATGTSDVSLGTLPDATTLAGGAFLLFGGSGYAGARAPDRTFATSLASTGGGLGVRDASGTLVDSVAWGTASNAFVEGTVANAPPVEPAPGQSAGRHPDGHDTNDNSVDFTIMEVPTPGAAN
jgi:hypothetical protein